MKQFKKFYIEITSICNLSCSFCPPTERKAQFLDIEKFRQILDEIRPYTKHIYFHVKGEPLLHTKIDQLLDISHEEGFKVNITTNGTLLHKAIPKLEEKPALRQINFSLHSFEGHSGSKNRLAYIQSVLGFAKKMAASGVIISLRLWNLNKGHETNEEKKINREALGIIETEFKLDQQIKEKVVPGSGLKLAERIYLNQDHQFDWPSLDAEEDDGVGFCHALRNQAGILVDGTVIPCCLDGEGVLKLGNIYQQSFSEIINGERATNIYDGFSRRIAVEELCRKCGYRKKFGN